MHCYSVLNFIITMLEKKHEYKIARLALNPVHRVYM